MLDKSRLTMRVVEKLFLLLLMEVSYFLFLFNCFILNIFYLIIFHILIIVSTEYHLKVVKPTGIVKTIPLPEVNKSGVSLLSTLKVIKYNQIITFFKILTLNKKVYEFDKPVEVLVSVSNLNKNILLIKKKTILTLFCK